LWPEASAAVVPLPSLSRQRATVSPWTGSIAAGVKAVVYLTAWLMRT
jgi:hypothetical protein